jgi:hypothetical protein
MSKKDLTKSILQRIFGGSDDAAKTVNTKNLLDAQVAKEVKAAQEAQDAFKAKEKLAKQYDEAINAENVDKAVEGANFSKGPSVAEEFQMRGYPKDYEMPEMNTQLRNKMAQEADIANQQRLAELAKKEEAAKKALPNTDDVDLTRGFTEGSATAKGTVSKIDEDILKAAKDVTPPDMLPAVIRDVAIRDLPLDVKGKLWKFMRENPGVSITAALGAIGAGTYALKDSKPGSVQQVPPDQAQGLPEGIEPQPEVPQAEQPQEAQGQAGTTQSVRQASFVSKSEPVQAPDTLEPDPLMQAQVEESDVQSRLQAAIDRRDSERRAAGIGQSLATMVAGGLGVASASDVKPNYTGFEDTMKNADRHLKDFAAKEEVQKSDPKSQISKNFRDFLKQFNVNIPESMSAEQAAKIMPYAYQKYAQEEAAKARKELAQENREARRELAAMSMMEKAASKESERQKYDTKLARDLRKDATSGEFGKMFNMYNTAKRTSDAFSKFLENPSGYKDYATLMGGLKVLQGDDSVVREAEMRLGMQATSTINKALNVMQRFATGKTLQPSQRKEMVDTIRILQDAAKNNYKRAVQPIVYQAKSEGVDLRNLFDDEMAQFLSNPIDDSQTAPIDLQVPQQTNTSNLQAPSKTIIKKGYNPTTNQTQFIYSDGTKEIVEGRK